MNNQSNMVHNRTGKGIKLISLVLIGTTTLFAINRVRTLWISGNQSTRSISSHSNQSLHPWSLPEEIFTDCSKQAMRDSIKIDRFGNQPLELSDAWNFSTMNGSKKHMILNTGWGKNRAINTDATTNKKGISSEKLMQSIPNGNFAYALAGLHPVQETKYPEFKNSMPEQQIGQGNNNDSSTTSNNQSYANGGGGSNNAGISSQPGTSSSQESPQKQPKATRSSNNNTLPSPLQKAGMRLIDIIKNKMLSTEKKGKDAYSQKETDQSFAHFKALVHQEWNKRGTEQKDRLAKLRAKLAVTDVVVALLETVASAPAPQHVTPILDPTTSKNLRSKRALSWDSLLTKCERLKIEETGEQANPYNHLANIYSKINDLLTTTGINPNTADYAEVRELEQSENIQKAINEKTLPNEDGQKPWATWINYLSTFLNTNFGTPWFNQAAFHLLIERVKKEITTAIKEEKEGNEDADLTALQRDIMDTFDLHVTQPLFTKTLGIDLTDYRSIFSTLTQSGNTNKLEEISSKLKQTGLSQTGMEQINTITKEIMGAWVALGSSFDGILGGYFKQIMHGVTTFINSPDGRDTINSVGGLVGSGLGLKALTGIFSSTTSSIITLAALGGAIYKWYDLTSSPNSEEKIKEFFNTLGDWGDKLVDGATSMFPAPSEIFGGSKAK